MVSKCNLLSCAMCAMTSSCPVGACLLLPGRAELQQKWLYRLFCCSDLLAWGPFCMQSWAKGEHLGFVWPLETWLCLLHIHTPQPTHIDIFLDSDSLWATHPRGQASPFPSPLFNVLSCPSCPDLESGTCPLLSSVTVPPSGNHPCALAPASQNPAHQPSARWSVADSNLCPKPLYIMISRHGCHI